MSSGLAVVHAAAANVHPWYAVRVRSRFEFVTSAVLEEKGYETFLPSYRSRRAWSDRMKEVEIPLFPGYLFCRFDAADPYRVLNSPGVVSVISVGPRPLPVDEQEVASIQKVCRSGRDTQPWPSAGGPARAGRVRSAGGDGRHRAGSEERMSDCCFSYAITALGIV